MPDIILEHDWIAQPGNINYPEQFFGFGTEAYVGGKYWLSSGYAITPAPLYNPDANDHVVTPDVIAPGGSMEMVTTPPYGNAAYGPPGTHWTGQFRMPHNGIGSFYGGSSKHFPTGGNDNFGNPTFYAWALAVQQYGPERAWLRPSFDNIPASGMAEDENTYTLASVGNVSDIGQYMDVEFQVSSYSGIATTLQENNIALGYSRATIPHSAWALNGHLYIRGKAGDCYSHWSEIWHSPYPKGVATVEGNLLVMEDAGSLGFESPLVEWQWEVEPAFALPFSQPWTTPKVSGPIGNTAAGAYWEWDYEEQRAEWVAEAKLQMGSAWQSEDFPVAAYLRIKNTRGDQSRRQYLATLTPVGVVVAGGTTVGMITDPMGFLYGAAVSNPSTSPQSLALRRHDGLSWHALPSVPDAQAGALAVHGSNLFLLAQGAITPGWTLRRSRDSGESFPIMSNPFPATYQGGAICTLADGRLVAAAVDGTIVKVRVSPDQGLSWDPEVALGPIDGAATLSLHSQEIAGFSRVVLGNATNWNRVASHPENPANWSPL